VLTDLVSLDDVRGHEATAWATARQLERLTELGYTWEKLPQPTAQPRRMRRDLKSGALISYPSYGEYVAMMNAFAEDRPDICRLHRIGWSQQGREVLVLQITNNPGVEEDEPEVFCTSTMHGNEATGFVLLLNLVDDILTSYRADPAGDHEEQVTHLVEELEIWINPLANPDGYVANSRYLASGFPQYPAANDPAGREAETQVIMNWQFGESFTCSANFHGGALVVNYPFDNYYGGTQYTPDDDMFIYISEEYSQYNLPMWNGDWYHGITNGADWYTITGGMQDWNYLYMGCNDVTIELGTKSPPASEIGKYWDDNRESMLAYLETCLIGVRGVVTNGSSGVPLDATISVVGRDHEIYTDPDVGDYHRMLLPGTYALTFEATGYDPVTVEDVVVQAGDPTYLDVAMGPTPQVTLSYPAEMVSPNGGESLETGVPTTVAWSGGDASTQFHVQYTDNYADILTLLTDGFENGSFDPAYSTGGNANWYVDSTIANAHTGKYSARAGTITHSQTSWLTRTVSGEGQLTFWYKVSSEANYDFFNFLIDGDRKVHASGTTGGWTRFTAPLSLAAT